MSSPDEIQQEIERTRASLTYQRGPADRQGHSPHVVPSGRRLKAAPVVRDRVMGSGDEGNGLDGAGDSLSAKSSATSARHASSGPQALRTQTQGNPLAVGLIAFGVGWFLSSLAAGDPLRAEPRRESRG